MACTDLTVGGKPYSPFVEWEKKLDGLLDVEPLSSQDKIVLGFLVLAVVVVVVVLIRDIGGLKKSMVETVGQVAAASR